MQAKDIMTKEVYTVRLQTTIIEAVQLCVEKEVSGLIVVNENDEAIGVLSEKDLLVAFDFLGETNSMINEFVSPEIISIEENTSIEDISRLLVQRNFKRVPIIKNKKAIGIVSRGDVLKWIASQEK